MRVSAKVDYAIRALAELAAAQIAAASAGPPGSPVKGERLAESQGIPLKFLENILTELRRAEIVASQRGVDGGYRLARDAAEISLADVIRAVEGPIATVRGSRPDEVEYTGAAAALGEVWIELRASMRGVLEETSLADLVTRSAGGRRARRRPARARADPDDLALLQLELLARVARDLRPELLSVGADELDAHLEAEMDDPLDHRLVRTVGRLEQQVEIVRAHPAVADPVHGPDEAHHELRRGVLVELARAADLLDPAAVHHRHLVGNLHRLLLVVRDENRRHVHLLVQPAQPVAQLRAHAGVERAERLVQEQHLGLHRERAGERHPLALTARELRGVAVRERLQLDELEQLVDARSGSRSSAACAPSVRSRRCPGRSCA